MIFITEEQFHHSNQQEVHFCCLLKVFVLVEIGLYNPPNNSHDPNFCYIFTAHVNQFCKVLKEDWYSGIGKRHSESFSRCWRDEFFTSRKLLLPFSYQTIQTRRKGWLACPPRWSSFQNKTPQHPAGREIHASPLPSD